MKIEINIPELETERLILRGPKPGDWQAEADFRASDRAKFVGGTETRLRVWRRFASRWGHWATHGYGMFTVTMRGSDEPLGVVGPLFPDGWSEPELGWILYAAAEGKGIAHEAASACRRYVYDDLGWTTAISYINPENTRSRALAERLGCVIEPDAKHPFDVPCLVYRHPAPEAAA